MDRVAIQRELREHLIEFLYLLTGNLIHTIIIVAELWEIPINLKIDDDTVLWIADGLYLGIFDCGERICHTAHARNAECHQAADFGIMQCHLAFLVSILVMHIVDGVHRGNIGFCQPRTVDIHAAQNFIVIQYVALHDGHFRTDLIKLVLVTATVNCHHQQLCNVGSCTKELHILADAHCGNAARDSVIIAVVRTHDIIVFILKRIRVDRYLCSELFPVLRQVFTPQNSQIGFCGSVEII